MTNKEFQEWLKQFPDEAEIDILTRTGSYSWCGDTYGHELFDPECGDHFELLDLRNNTSASEDIRKCFLQLGER